jgi:cob(I)alamin adenosyltransferase
MARLTKIYTKTGDRGETGLVGGKRISKDSPRIWAYGTVDELNASIGIARAFNAEEKSREGRSMDEVLSRIQNELFNLGTELATLPEDAWEGMPRIQQTHIAALEKLMDELEAKLKPLTQFILPGGCKTAAALHQARTICRRAERFCVRLAGKEKIGECVAPYLNRLGDALFVLARWANQVRGVKESVWKK